MKKERKRRRKEGRKKGSVQVVLPGFRTSVPWRCLQEWPCWIVVVRRSFQQALADSYFNLLLVLSFPPEATPARHSPLPRHQTGYPVISTLLNPTRGRLSTLISLTRRQQWHPADHLEFHTCCLSSSPALLAAPPGALLLVPPHLPDLQLCPRGQALDFSLKKKKKYFIYLFTWLSQVLVEACGIFVTACRIFSWGMWDL